MEMQMGVRPALYVGTYAKYNNGSIRGAWLYLEDYDDAAEFYTACRELHSDEADPEFMFQAFEGFPRQLYSESSVSETLFEFAALAESEREVVSAYYSDIDSSASVSPGEVLDLFVGRYDSFTEYAEELAGGIGLFDDVPENLRHYFDMEAWASDLKLETVYAEVNGEFFIFTD